MVVGVRMWRGHVQRGVALEEPYRLEQEACRGNRHHRPILRPGNVVMAERVPDDDVLSVDRPVGARPLREACTARMQVRIFARGVPLIRPVGRDPEVISDEPCPLADGRIRLGEGERRPARQQTVAHRLGEPVGYRLLPGGTTFAFAQPDAPVSKRAGFIHNHLWVTPYRPDERYAAGEYPNLHPGGAGLPEWTSADRPIDGEDVVVWYTFGHHHVPRPEDWPVMPVATIGFTLKPVGFFDRNPALDVPPPTAHHDHCHTA